MMSLQDLGRQLTEEIAILFSELGDSNLPEEVHLLRRPEGDATQSQPSGVEKPH